MGRLIPTKATPGVFRPQPDRDDAASASSVVLLDDIDCDEADLPAYEDVVGPGRIGREAANDRELQA